MRKESFQGILLGIVIMCAVFAFITVAWAAFSQTLTVSGTATVAAQSWDVGFSNTTSVIGENATVTCVASASGATCPNSAPSLTKTQFAGAAVNLGTLSEVGGTLTYSWYIINNGDFNATVSDISNKTGCTGSGSCKLAVSCNFAEADTSYAFKNDLCGAISADLNFGESAASTSTVINKKGTDPTAQAISLVLSYGDIPASVTSLPSQDFSISLSSGLTLSYGQTS